MNESEQFLKLVRDRYSVRKFQQTPLMPDDLAAILEAGRLAPTAHNNQPQRILVIESADALTRLKTCTRCHFDAPAALLICSDKPACWVRPYDGRQSTDVDAAIVTTHMMLAAAARGVGTTWVMHFRPEAVRESFAVPDAYEPVALLMMGYPAPDAAPSPAHAESKALDELVFYDRF